LPITAAFYLWRFAFLAALFEPVISTFWALIVNPKPILPDKVGMEIRNL
jgi:hypothetical protein